MKNRWTIVTAIIVVLALLLVAAGWLSNVSQAADDEPQEDIVFPRDSPDAPVRVKRTANAPPPQPQPDEGALTLPKHLPKLDTQAGTSVQRAVGVPGKGNLVFEVGAIAHSELADKMLRCHEQNAQAGLDKLRKLTGLDLLQDVEQIGMSEGVMALGGHLGGLKISKELGRPERYGADAMLYTANDEQQDKDTTYIARVGNGLVLVGAERDAVLHAVDRAEGRAPSEVADRGYADVRGRLTEQDLTRLLANNDADAPHIKQLRELAKGVGLRMNVADRVALSLDIEATNKDNAQDLSASLKTAVTFARQLARNEGHKKSAWLLDQARFHDATDAGFAMDLAVPGEIILKAMGCDERGNAISAPAAQPPPNPSSSTQH